MNSLSYHESHSHGSLGLPFQAYSQEDPYGQYFVPYHWHEEVEFIYVTKGSLVLRTQNRTRLLQEGHIYFINPGTLHGLFGNSPFSHHYALVFRLDMLNFLQTDSCQTSYLVPLCTGKYLFPDSEALAPELTAQIAALIKKAADEYRNCDTSLTAALSIKITLLQILELLFASDQALKFFGCRDMEDLITFAHGDMASLVSPENEKKIQSIASLQMDMDVKTRNGTKTVWAIIRRTSSIYYGHTRYVALVKER